MVKIGDKLVGKNQPCYIVAEVGINHNGDLDVAKRLIDVAVNAGCDAVKFQKRTPEVCVPREQGDKMRDTPWGYMTYMEYRCKVEFGEAEYTEIDRYCRNKGISWHASCWDEASVDFIDKFGVPCYKIASASLTDHNLLSHTRSMGRPVILSTGMSTIEQIDKAVEVLGKTDLVLLHSCSTYPANYEDLHLRVIPMFQRRYSIPIGYSGHETGLPSSIAAVAIGACIMERHITLDRSMWGSDQAASLEPNGISRLVRDIRLIERALGEETKRVVEGEKAMIRRLRRVG